MYRACAPTRAPTEPRPYLRTTGPARITWAPDVVFILGTLALSSQVEPDYERGTHQLAAQRRRGAVVLEGVPLGEVRLHGARPPRQLHVRPLLERRDQGAPPNPRALAFGIGPD